MSFFDQQTDADLVSQCNTGTRQDAVRAFEALYARHKDYVVRVAMRYLHDTDLALDVLQDTFSTLLRKFPPPGAGIELTAQLRTLLYAIAKNHSISLLRKNRNDGAPVDFNPDDIAAPEEMHSEVASLLAGLSPKQREVIVLRFVDDLSIAEIATALSVPAGTIKSRLHGAVRELRKSRYVREFFEK
jgi:RNA polymerase sigma-70 factor (ECF subfamily)